jgi:hypothetical protein
VRTGAAAVCAALALLVFAAVAIAATPATGLHKGESSQGRRVDVKVGTDHKIRRFRIDWKAPCEAPKSWWGPDGTTVKFPSEQPGDGSFGSSGKYTGKPDADGYTGHFKYRLDGKFTKSSKAHGTFEIRVRVTKSGKTIDRCHKSLTWQVS